MLDFKTVEKLEKTLEEIRKCSAEGIPIIVEGGNDEKTLRKLGIEGPIHRIPSGKKTLLNSVEDLPDYEEAIILTDFDREGEKLAIFCKKHLEKLGTRAPFRLRNKLKNCVRKAVKDIEGIYGFIQTEKASRTRCNLEFDRSF